MKVLLLRYRRPLITSVHAILIAASMFGAYLLRFDFYIPSKELPLMYNGMVVAGVLKLLVFGKMGLYRGWWRFVSLHDLIKIFCVNVVASIVAGAALALLFQGSFPRSIYCLDFLLCFLLTAGARFAVRLYNEAAISEFSRTGRKRVLIYGAGAAGRTLVREIRENPSLNYLVVGFLDDDPNKRNTSVLGVRVLGAGREAARIIAQGRRAQTPIEEIIIAIPSASGSDMRDALANCRAAGVNCRTVPGIGDMLNGKVLTAQIRNISVTDLLGREPVGLEETRIRNHIEGRSILITGAAGSIGSELCRQVSQFDPRILVAFDQAESDLFKIELELRAKFPSLRLVAEIGDIRDAGRIGEAIQRHSVDSIYHAAAYKHVPMMEGNVIEAIKNNIFGTSNVVEAASRYGVADFLMVSSDKAVNPTSVMGVTKRVAELIVSRRPDLLRPSLKCVCVRFGNVLASNGSVVPLFEAQIRAGGPVTVTHPEIRRYFMTIREAVQLVLQASTMGKGSEIFVLDMGEPIRILDMAKNMIRLAGFIPDEQIEIRYTGLRPGEKLFEELISAGENILPTYHEKIKIFMGQGAPRETLRVWIEDLRVLVQHGDARAIVAHLKTLIPEYHPDAQWESQPMQKALVAGQGDGR